MLHIILNEFFKAGVRIKYATRNKKKNWNFPVVLIDGLLFYKYTFKQRDFFLFRMTSHSTF